MSGERDPGSPAAGRWDTERDGSAVVFWVATAVGWAIIGFGILSLLRRSEATHPIEVGTWFVGLALAHDLVLAPLVTWVAVLLGPRLPERARGAVIGGLVVSGILALVSLPVLLGARAPDNPSLLPRDYPFGLGLCLALTWMVTALVIVVAVRRRRR
jgi:hypothetical protein